MHKACETISDKELKKLSFTLLVLPIAPAIILFKFGHFMTVFILLFVFWLVSCITFVSKIFSKFLYSNSKILLKSIGDIFAKIVLFVVYVF